MKCFRSNPCFARLARLASWIIRSNPSPLPHLTVYVTAKEEDDVTALRVSLFASVKALPWYKTVVLGLQPQLEAKEPAEPDAAIPVVPEELPFAFDEVASAKEVYGSFLAGDATEEKCWTSEMAPSVLTEYHMMNIHYYMQKGRQSMPCLSH